MENPSALLPASAKYGKVRYDSQGARDRMSLQEYLRRYADVDFTHGFCPDYLAEYYQTLEEAAEGEAALMGNL